MASTTIAGPDVGEERRPASTRATTGGGSIGRGRLSALGCFGFVFAVALVARLVAHDVVITADEDNWMRRAGGFTYGLANGQLGRTYQNGHPGVTTMWVGMLSQGLDGAIRFADRVHGLRFVGQVPGYMAGLAQARIGFAVLGALGAAVAALLFWR